MNAPLQVVVKNRGKNARFLRWTKDNSVWIDAGASITLDYEPWSCADRKQREALVAELNSGMTELVMRFNGTVNIAQAGDVCLIEYNPAGNVTPKAPSTVYKNEAKSLNTLGAMKEDEAKHTVHTKPNQEITSMGFRSEPVMPPASAASAQSADKDGFIVSTPGGGGKMVSTDGKSHIVIAGAKPQAEPEPVKEAAAEPEDPTDGFREAYAECIAEKRWDDALRVLKDCFGDQVTISVASLKALKKKDWDSVVAKYGWK